MTATTLDRQTDELGVTRDTRGNVVMVDGEAFDFGFSLPDNGPWVPHFDGGATNYPLVRRVGDAVLWAIPLPNGEIEHVREAII